MHHNNGYKYAIALFAFSILGCQYFKSKPTVDQTQAVARVYDKASFLSSSCSSPMLASSSSNIKSPLLKFNANLY